MVRAARGVALHLEGAVSLPRPRRGEIHEDLG